MPSHRDIAKAAGVSKSTVSLALAGARKIPVATRDRILQIAHEMEYQRDGLASLYMAHMRRGLPEEARPVIAVVSTFPLANESGRNAHYRAFLSNVRGRSQELGYQIEEFEVVAQGISPERLGKILKTRAIQAVIVAPSGRPIDPLPENCEELSVVLNSPAFVNREFDCVRPDHFHNTLLSVKKTTEMGYQRIGLAWLGEDAVNYRDEIEAAWELVKSRSQAVWPDPLLFPEYNAAAISGFLLRERVDVLITNWLDFKKHLPEAEARRISAQAVKLVGMGLRPNSRHKPGIDRCDYWLDVESVDAVVNKSRSFDRGIASSAKTVTLRGVWRS